MPTIKQLAISPYTCLAPGDSYRNLAEDCGCASGEAGWGATGVVNRKVLPSFSWGCRARFLRIIRMTRIDFFFEHFFFDSNHATHSNLADVWQHDALCPQSVRFRPLRKLSRSPWWRPQFAKLTAQFWAKFSWILLMISMAWNHLESWKLSTKSDHFMPFFLQVQTVEKVVEVPMVGQTSQGTTREVDIPLAPRREVGSGEMLQHLVLLSWFFFFLRFEVLLFGAFDYCNCTCQSPEFMSSLRSFQEHPEQIVQQAHLLL